MSLYICRDDIRWMILADLLNQHQKIGLFFQMPHFSPQPLMKGLFTYTYCFVQSIHFHFMCFPLEPIPEEG